MSDDANGSKRQTRTTFSSEQGIEEGRCQRRTILRLKVEEENRRRQTLYSCAMRTRVRMKMSCDGHLKQRVSLAEHGYQGEKQGQRKTERPLSNHKQLTKHRHFNTSIEVRGEREEETRMIQEGICVHYCHKHMSLEFVALSSTIRLAFMNICL